jgi:hypothetical protein
MGGSNPFSGGGKKTGGRAGLQGAVNEAGRTGNKGIIGFAKSLADKTGLDSAANVVMRGLEVADLGRAAVLSGLSEGLDVASTLTGGHPRTENTDRFRQTGASWEDFVQNVKHHVGFGDIIEADPKTRNSNIWVKRGLGLAGDIAADPLTYVSGGAAHIGEEASGAVGRKTLLSTEDAAGRLLKGGNPEAAERVLGGRSVAQASKAELADVGIAKGVYFARRYHIDALDGVYDAVSKGRGKARAKIAEFFLAPRADGTARISPEMWRRFERVPGFSRIRNNPALKRKGIANVKALEWTMGWRDSGIAAKNLKGELGSQLEELFTRFGQGDKNALRTAIESGKHEGAEGAAELAGFFENARQAINEITGSNIPKFENYLTHILTDDARQAVGKAGGMGQAPGLKRKILKSIDEANEDFLKEGSERLRARFGGEIPQLFKDDPWEIAYDYIHQAERFTRSRLFEKSMQDAGLFHFFNDKAVKAAFKGNKRLDRQAEKLAAKGARAEARYGERKAAAAEVRTEIEGSPFAPPSAEKAAALEGRLADAGADVDEFAAQADDIDSALTELVNQGDDLAERYAGALETDPAEAVASQEKTVQAARESVGTAREGVFNAVEELDQTLGTSHDPNGRYGVRVGDDGKYHWRGNDPAEAHLRAQELSKAGGLNQGQVVDFEGGARSTYHSGELYSGAPAAVSPSEPAVAASEVDAAKREVKAAQRRAQRARAAAKPTQLDRLDRLEFAVAAARGAGAPDPVLDQIRAAYRNGDEELMGQIEQRFGLSAEGVPPDAREAVDQAEGEVIAAKDKHASLVEAAKAVPAPATPTVPSEQIAAAKRRLNAAKGRLSKAERSLQSGIELLEKHREVLGSDYVLRDDIQPLIDENAARIKELDVERKGISKAKKAAEAEELRLRKKAEDLWAKAETETDPRLKLAARLEAQASQAGAKMVGSNLASAATSMAKAHIGERDLELLQAVMNDGLAKVNKYQRLWADPETAKALIDLREMMAPAKTGKLLRLHDTVMSRWKAYSLLSPGYHFRNGYSAMFMNAVAGYSGGVRGYTRFGRLWRVAQKDGIESALKQIKEATYRDAFEKTWEMRGALFQETGIRDLADAVGGATNRKGFLPDRFERVDPSSLDNAALKLNTKTAGNVERLVRGPLFIDGLEKGLTVQEAYARVVRFHFDYTEGISRFERDVMKRVVPFYTWTRLNFGLQLEYMARNPGVYTRYSHYQRNLELGTDEEQFVPSYLGELGGFRMPATDSKGHRGYVAPDLPFLRLGQTFDADQLMAQVTPLIKTPLELDKGTRYFNDIPFSKKPVEVPLTSLPLAPLFEIAGGKFGLPKVFRKGATYYYENEAQGYKVEQALPLLGRLRRIVPSDAASQEKALSAWLSTGLGLTVTFNGPQQQESEMRRREEEIKKVVDAYNRRHEAGKSK